MSDAAKNLNPYDRKCWLQEEIGLEHFPYEDDYRCKLENIFMLLIIINHCRYEMSNCLLEAAIQKAYEKCSCIPSYMFPSNDSCFGDSLNCFKSQMYYLGIRTIFRLIQKS